MPDQPRKTPTDQPDTRGRFVLVEDAVDAVRHRKPLPEITDRDASILNTLFEAASLDPDDWHRIPGTNLALRVARACNPGRTFRFEIHSDEAPGELHRYHYDIHSRVLRRWSNSAVHHYPLQPERHLPHDSDDLALCIVALAHEFPAPAQPAKSTPVRRAGDEDARPVLPELGSLQATLADLIQRLSNQWFGPTAEDWSRAKRFAYAFAGSLTFFLGWLFAIATPDVKKLILDHLYQTTILSTHLYFVLFSAWFAWLVCWKDLKYGPVRLYLSGFLLPYIVWLLIDRLFQFGLPNGNGGSFS